MVGGTRPKGWSGVPGLKGGRVTRPKGWVVVPKGEGLSTCARRGSRSRNFRERVAKKHEI